MNNKHIRIKNYDTEFKGWAVEVFLTDDLSDDPIIVAYILKKSLSVLWIMDEYESHPLVTHKIDSFIEKKSNSFFQELKTNWVKYLIGFIVISFLFILLSEPTTTTVNQSIDKVNGLTSDTVPEAKVIPEETSNQINAVEIIDNNKSLEINNELQLSSDDNSSQKVIPHLSVDDRFTPENVCKSIKFNGYKFSDWNYLEWLGWGCSSDLQYYDFDGSINEIVFSIEAATRQMDSVDKVGNIKIQASIFDVSHKNKVVSEFLKKINLFYSRLKVEIPKELLEHIANEKSFLSNESFGTTTFIVEDDYDVGYGLLITIEPRS